MMGMTQISTGTNDGTQDPIPGASELADIFGRLNQCGATLAGVEVHCAL